MKRTSMQMLHEIKPRHPEPFLKVHLMKDRMGSQARLRITKVGRHHADTEVIDATNPEHVGKEMILYRDMEPVRSMPTSWLPHLVVGTELVIHTQASKSRFPDVRCIDITPSHTS